MALPVKVTIGAMGGGGVTCLLVGVIRSITPTDGDSTAVQRRQSGPE